MPVNLQLPPNLPNEFKNVKIIDISATLPVNPKYTWPVRGGVRNVNVLTTIAFHHDAWPKTVSSRFTDMQLILEITRDHIASTKNIPGGDPGFPYHIFVRSGIVYLCNPLEWRTYGVKNCNDFTVHVCLSGDYVNHDSMTDADRAAMYVAYFLCKGYMPNFQALKGHKQLSATSCPGYDMDRIRADILSTEEKLEYIDSPSSNRAICYAFAERIEALGSRFADKKYGEYAKSLVMRLEPILGELGYAGDVTPEGIVKRIIEIYKNTHNTRFEGEAFKKLTSGAKFAQENGIL